MGTLRSLKDRKIYYKTKLVWNDFVCAQKIVWTTFEYTNLKMYLRHRT